MTTVAKAKSKAPKALFEDDDESSASSLSEESKPKIKGKKASKLKINRKYAQDFEARKQREELKRAKFNLAGGDGDDINVDGDDSASSSSSEDEDAEMWTKRTDFDILKTINAIRSKDARIYDPRQRFFGGGSDEGSKSSEEEYDEYYDKDDSVDHQSSRKPKRYKDVVREQVLDKIEKDERGVTSADDGNDDLDSSVGEEKPSDSRSNSSSRLAYNQQQQELRQAFIDSTKDEDGPPSSGRGDEAGDEWLTLKKSKKPSRSDAGSPFAASFDTEYDAEIRKLEESLRNSANDGSPDRASGLVDPRGEVQDGERFLLEYFKRRGWVENEEDEDDSSTSSGDDDIVEAKHSTTSQARPIDDSGSDGDDDDDDDDASLNELEKADDFEAQYNFRFEQAAGGAGGSGAPLSGADHSLVRYGRGQEMQTLRRKDESRKEKRLARQERKAAERQAKEEQLRRLKNAKRQEIQRKLQQVKAVLGEVQHQEQKGDAGEGVMDEATILKLLEGDFDPQKFEEQMKEIYGDDFYARPDAEWRNDKDVRASLQHDEDGELLVGQDTEDGGLYDNVDDDADDGGDYADDDYQEDGDWMEAEVEDGDFQETEGETNLEKKVKSKLMDELYKLDYEDIVAGLPTRFKYRQVQPNSFGLSTEEILFARDSTLKQFVSLKKIAPYREEEHFVGSKKRRRFREMLKHDLEEEIASTRATSSSAPSSVAIQQTDQAEKAHAGEGKEEEGKKRKKNRRLKKKKKADDEPRKEIIGPESQKSNTALTKELPPSSDGTTKEAESHRSRDQPLPADPTLKEMSDPKGGSANAKRSKKRKRKNKKHIVEGISGARLASYGL